MNEEYMPIMRTGMMVRMSLLDENQALINHGQTLSRLKERGGISACEALAIAEKRKWKFQSAPECMTILQKLAEDECPTIDLAVESWKRVAKAASESKWIPPEYCASDWENDVCEFLREGINIDLLKKVWAHGYNAGHNEGIGCGHPLAGRCRHQGDSEAEANVDDIQRILKGDS